MWPFKRNKYKKLKKEEVQDAIYKLEKQEMLIESILLEKQEELEHYLKKGKREKSAEIRLLYAKKITHLKEEMRSDSAKGSYLIYNVKLLKKLKEAIEDKEFFMQTGKVSLGNLLTDQKGLARFLNQALNTKVAAEEVLTSADEVFQEVQAVYEPNKDIYGIGTSEDEILSVFEEFEEDELEDLEQSPTPPQEGEELAEERKPHQQEEPALQAQADEQE